MDESKITEKLNTIINLLALHVVKKTEYAEQVRLLMISGLRDVEIAKILGKTRNNVAVTMSKLRKMGTKAK
ncbi:MAG: hypothetical protein Q7S92_03895 [Candidatus Diapherotrites archaeon]|nr:hypothetical protein [Candidatus Diapherotrites archaeon]